MGASGKKSERFTARLESYASAQLHIFSLDEELEHEKKLIERSHHLP